MLYEVITIFTSIICMIYLMGIKPEKLSEAEIKKLAKQYGMVEGNSIYSEQKASNKSSESVV